MFSSDKSSTKSSLVAVFRGLFKSAKSCSSAQRASVLYPEDAGEDYFAFVPAVEIVHSAQSTADWSPSSFFNSHYDVDCPSPSGSSFTNSSASHYDDDLPLPAPYRPWLKTKRSSSKRRSFSTSSSRPSSRTYSSRSTSSSTSSSSLRHEIVASSADVIVGATLPDTATIPRRPTATRLSWVSQTLQDKDLNNLVAGELFEYIAAKEAVEAQVVPAPKTSKKHLFRFF